MNIAILNLPFDNNYGGNLQRYALMKVLERMGHHAVHINLLERYHLKWYVKPYSYTKRFIQKYILGKDVKIFLEQYMNKQSIVRSMDAKMFYESYIEHTKPITRRKQLKKIIENNYDAVIVGSDQVWRESMTKQIGIDSYFLSFVESDKIKRIAYAVSMGSENECFSSKIVPILSNLYSRFNAVSVREEYALSVLNNYGWTSPKASWVLDPTMLLDANDYKKVIDEKGFIDPLEKKVFCYILDKSSDFDDRIDTICKQWNSPYLFQSLNDAITIEEWLFRISSSKLVVTDSYHGCVFSLVFGRPFIFLGNKRRGNARVESLLKMLNISPGSTSNYNVEAVYARLKGLKKESLSFLEKSLC